MTLKYLLGSDWKEHYRLDEGTDKESGDSGTVGNGGARGSGTGQDSIGSGTGNGDISSGQVISEQEQAGRHRRVAELGIWQHFTTPPLHRSTGPKSRSAHTTQCIAKTLTAYLTYPRLSKTLLSWRSSALENDTMPSTMHRRSLILPNT